MNLEKGISVRVLLFACVTYMHVYDNFIPSYCNPLQDNTLGKEGTRLRFFFLNLHSEFSFW